MAASYFGTAIYRERRTKMVAQIVAALSSCLHEFDAIAFRGMSGALVGPTVADLLNKKILVVRKPTDGHNHSGIKVEGEFSETRYIIIDDFVSTGETVREIIQAVKDESVAFNDTPLFVLVYDWKGKTSEGDEWVYLDDYSAEWVPLDKRRRVPLVHTEE